MDLNIEEAVLRSKTLIKQKRYDDAINLLTKYFNTNDESVAFYNCGKVMMNAGDDNKAWEYFNKTISRNPKYKYKIYLFVAQYKSYHECVEEGIEYFEKVINSNSPYTVGALLDYAQIRINNKEYKEAETLLEQAHSIEPSNPRVIFLLGKIKKRLNKFDEALMHFEKILEMEDANNKEYAFGEIVNTKIIDGNKDHYAKAKEFLNNQFEIAKRDIEINKFEDAIFRLELLVKYKNHVDESNKYLNLIKKLSSIESSLKKNKAYALKLYDELCSDKDASLIQDNIYRLGQKMNRPKKVVITKQEEIEEYTEMPIEPVITRNPDLLDEEIEAHTKYKQVVQYVKEKDYEEAKAILIELFNSCLKETAVVEYGIICHIEGNFERAKICFEKVIEYNKNRSFHSEQYYIAYAMLGDLYYQNGENEIAKEYLTIGLKSIDRHAQALLLLGKIYASENNYFEAKKNFNELSGMDDKRNRNYALLELGKLETQYNNTDEAIEYYEEIIRYNENNKSSMYALLELGRAYAKVNEHKKSIACYERILLLVPKGEKSIYKRSRQHALLELSKVLIKINQEKKAVNYLEELLDTDSRNFALLELGKLESFFDNDDKAREYFLELKSYKNIKDNACATLELGRLEAKENNHDKARQYFNELISMSEKDKQFAFLELSKLETKEGNYDKAEEYLRKLLNTQSREYALLELGRLEREKENYDEALKYFNDLKAMGGRNRIYALQEISIIESRLGKQISKDNLMMLLDNLESRSFALYELGCILLDEGDIETAEKYFKELDAGDDDAYSYSSKLKLGKIYEKNGNIEAAREYYTKLINNETYRQHALILLANLEQNLGSYYKSRELYEEALEITDENIPTPTTKKTQEALFNLGKIYSAVGEKARARKCFEKLVEIKSTIQYVALFELGRIENSDGNYIEAKKIFEELLDTPNRNYALLELGRLEVVLYDYDSARKHFEELSKLDGNDKKFALQELVRLELRCENKTKAIGHLYELLNSDDNSKKLAADEVISYINEDNNEAEMFLKELSHTDITGVLELCKIEMIAGNLNSARKYINSILKVNESKRPYALFGLAKIESIAGNYKESENILEELIEKQAPNKFGAILELGKLKVKTRDYDAARKLFESLSDTSKSGLSIVELCKLEQEVGNYKRVRELLSTIPNIEVNKDLINVEICLEIAEKNYTKAKELLEKYKEQFINADYGRYSEYIEGLLNGNVEDLESKYTVWHIIAGHKDDFNSDINIGSLYKQVRLTLKNNAMDNDDSIVRSKMYHVTFDDAIATIDGEETNCVEVVSFINKILRRFV